MKLLIMEIKVKYCIIFSDETLMNKVSKIVKWFDPTVNFTFVYTDLIWLNVENIMKDSGADRMIIFTDNIYDSHVSDSSLFSVYTKPLDNYKNNFTFTNISRPESLAVLLMINLAYIGLPLTERNESINKVIKKIDSTWINNHNIFYKSLKNNNDFYSINNSMSISI